MGVALDPQARVAWAITSTHSRKVANLRRLVDEHPEIRTVVTWNAESNAHMLAINDVLGFRPHSRWEQTTTTLPGD